LSQSLPAAIQSAVPASTPSPVLSSIPSWGGLDSWLPQRGDPIPTVGPVCPTPQRAALRTVHPPVIRPRPQLRVCNPPNWDCRATTCAGANVPWWERIKAWLGFQPTTSSVPIWVPQHHQLTVRAYFPPQPGDCGTAGGGCSSGSVGCATPPAPVRERGGWLQRPTCEVAIPITPLPTTPDCGTTCRPRVSYVPLSPRVEGQVGCETDRATGVRPAARLLSYFHRDRCGSQTDGCGGDCPPPPPTPVHYASPSTPSDGTVRYAQPCNTIPPPAPTGNLSTPTGNPTAPIVPHPAVPSSMPMTLPPVGNGKVGATPAPKPSVAGIVSASQAFTNP
jgi:hypothetical protein